jgi:cephalosporin hydroxylase
MQSEAFRQERAARIKKNEEDRKLRHTAKDFLFESIRAGYSYNFDWLGRPIIQYPQDMLAVQELIWRVRPDLVIETGVAHGGSLILSASMLALLDYSDARKNGTTLDPSRSKRRVIGIDIEIRPHNRAAIEAHPLSDKITLVEGSSTSVEVITAVKREVKRDDRVMVILDSNHTHEHVHAELEFYAPLVSADSYCIVFDTVIEELPDGFFANRPWSRGNSPLTAVQLFLAKLESEAIAAADGKRLRFEVDSRIDAKLLISVAPSGYLRRVS